MGQWLGMTKFYHNLSKTNFEVWPLFAGSIFNGNEVPSASFVLMLPLLWTKPGLACPNKATTWLGLTLTGSTL